MSAKKKAAGKKKGTLINSADITLHASADAAVSDVIGLSTETFDEATTSKTVSDHTTHTFAPSSFYSSTAAAKSKLDEIPSDEEGDVFDTIEHGTASKPDTPGLAEWIALLDTIGDLKTISDLSGMTSSVLEPKPFCGKETENPLDWLKYFNRYADFKHLAGDDRIRYFSLFMRDAATTWFEGITDDETMKNWDSLQAAFTTKFEQPEIIRMRNAGLTQTRTQGPDESVYDYYEAMMKLYKYLDSTEETKYHAVLRGLKPYIRTQVMQQNQTSTLDELLKIARKAELANVMVQNDDAAFQAIKDSVQTIAAATKENQASIKALTEAQQKFIEAQTTVQMMTAHDRLPMLQQQPQQPQQQRYSANNSFNPSTQNVYRGQPAADGQRQRFQPRSQQPHYERSNDQNQTRTCGNCGLPHGSQQTCYATGMACRQCGRIGHFQRVCRSKAYNKSQ